jgi:hypothetical protein
MKSSTMEVAKKDTTNGLVDFDVPEHERTHNLCCHHGFGLEKTKNAKLISTRHG